MRWSPLLAIGAAACVGVDFNDAGSGAGASGAFGGGGAGATASGGGPVGGAGAAAGASSGGEGGGCTLGTSENCGACGHSCAGGECFGAVCQPVALFTPPVGASLDGRGVTIAEDSVVWLLSASGDPKLSGTFKLAVDAAAGTAPTRVMTNTGQRVLYRAPDLYVSYNSIHRAPLDAEDTAGEFLGGLTCVDYMAFDAAGRLYCRHLLQGSPPPDPDADETVRRFETPIQSGGVDPFWSTSEYSVVAGIVVVGEDVYFGRGGGLSKRSTEQFGSVTDQSEHLVVGDVVEHGGTIFFGHRRDGVDELMFHTIGAQSASLLQSNTAAGLIHADDTSVYYAEKNGMVLSRYDRVAQSTQGSWPLGAGARGIVGTAEFVFVTLSDGTLLRLAK